MHVAMFHVKVDAVRYYDSSAPTVELVSGDARNNQYVTLHFDSELDMVNAALQMMDVARHIISTPTIIRIQADISDAKAKAEAPLADWERELLDLNSDWWRQHQPGDETR
jgi:hypothetical protein